MHHHAQPWLPFLFVCFKELFIAEQWWLTPLVPGLSRQRQADLHELNASLGYTEKP